MNLQLYNTLPEWAIELSTGRYTSPVVVEKIILSLPANDEVQTEKRRSRGDLSGLLGIYNPFIQSEFDSLRLTLFK